MTEEQSAFLRMLRHSEGTDLAADPYRVTYGYHYTIKSLLEHPAVSGEWLGVSLANLGPQYAHSISTAAGAYQIIKPTWISCRDALKLNDFTGPSQDDAAMLLIKDHGGFDKLNSGDIEGAITACSNCWASLSGSESGQPQHSMASLLYVYQMNLENA